MHEPKTVPEMFDAAQNGEEFGAVFLGMFRTLESMMDEDDDE